MISAEEASNLVSLSDLELTKIYSAWSSHKMESNFGLMS